MQYAQIRAGKVNIIEVADATALAALRATGLTIIDISGRDPRPATGWGYDADASIFLAPQEQTPCVCLHVEISGGDGGDPPGISNDGVDSLSVSAVFRATEDSNSDIVEDVNITRRINIRDDKNNVANIIKISFAAGICNFSYATARAAGLFHIAQADFTEKINGVSIKLIGDTQFKVYEDYTS